MEINGKGIWEDKLNGALWKDECQIGGRWYKNNSAANKLKFESKQGIEIERKELVIY